MISRIGLLKEKHHGIIFVLTLALATIALYLSPPEGLSIAGYRALIVFAICAIFWMFQVVPLAITSILAFVLLPLFGVMETNETYALFGNKAVFFIIGALILSTGLVQSGLSGRVALWVLRKTGLKPKRLLAGVYFLCVVASFFMPEHAVAAMMLPIVIEVAHWLKLEPGKDPFGKALFLAVVWGCLTGGVATFLGGARNILAVAILEETTGQSISFAQWVVAVMPISVAISMIGFIILMVFFKTKLADASSAHEHLMIKSKQLGKLSLSEQKMIVIVVVTILAWVFFSEIIGLATIALLAVVVLFISRVVTWQDAEKHVHWGVILMYAGAIALGVALERTGGALFVTNTILHYIPVHPWILLIGIMIVSILLTEIMSNSAVVAMFLPVALSIALSNNMNPVAMTYVVAVAAGFAFMLPMGSPPNALSYATGYYTLKDSVRSGAILNIVALLLFIVGIAIWWPIIGITVI